MTNSDLSSTRPVSGALEVYLLGVVDYDALLVLQERLMREAAQSDDGRAALLVCEHPPLITVGREGSSTDLRCTRQDLIARQISVRWMNRGGGSVVHVPGQLAAYPILSLAARGWGLVDYRDRLRSALLDACLELRVKATINPDSSGIFARTGMLGQVGVAIRRGVSTHGLFLNVSAHADALGLVRTPWGRMSSLSVERGGVVPMSKVRECLIRRLVERLEFDRHHWHTGHPLLVRSKRMVYFA